MANDARYRASQPLVSVVVRTRNRSRLLTRALDCLANQTYSKIEILVVDHNSTDDTASVVDSYGQGIRYIRHEGHFRDTFNVWRDKIRGEYLSFLDDDDYLLPRCIEKLVRVLDERKEIHVVFARHCMYYPHPDRSEIVAFTPKRDCRNMRRLLLQSNIIPWNAVILRTGCLDNTPPLPEGLVGAFDWFFWIQLEIKGCNFLQIPDVLGIIRMSPDSVQLQSERMSLGGLQCVRHYGGHMTIRQKIANGYYLVHGTRLIRHGLILLENHEGRKGRRYILTGLLSLLPGIRGKSTLPLALLLLYATLVSNPSLARSRMEALFRRPLFRTYAEKKRMERTAIGH